MHYQYNKSKIMTTINLPEFQSYTLQNFHEYLLLQATYDFQIVFPKETSSNDCNETIHWEYMIALYIGQELANLSRVFSYYSPSPLVHGRFQFDVNTACLLLLAKTLHRVVQSLYCNEELPDSDLHEDATEFWIKTTNENITPACGGLLYIAYEYFD